MAELPPEISTALVHMDAPLSFIGEPGRLHVEILPSVSLVWAATGTPVVNFEDMMDLADGQALEIQLPHTDQDGFLDGAGNTITGWYYTVKITYEKDGQLRVFPERDFQVLVGQAEVDLALVPAGEAAVPQVAPVLTVTSIEGFTGPVSLAELQLERVDNTNDAEKPISTATQTALDLKAPKANPTFTGTVTGVTKSMVGLSAVDNTADAAKPISTLTQAALDAKLDDAQLGAASGVAPLGADSKVPETHIPTRLSDASLSATFVASTGALQRLRDAGDGMTAAVDVRHRGTSGYIFHAVTEAGSGGFIQAYGTDEGTAGAVLRSHKNSAASEHAIQHGGASMLNYWQGYSNSSLLHAEVYKGNQGIKVLAKTGQGFGDGVTTSGSTTFTSAAAAFVAGDVGKAITQTTTRGSVAPSGSIPAGTTIVSVESGTSVTLSQPAGATGTTIPFLIAGRVPDVTQPLLTFYDDNGTTVLGQVRRSGVDFYTTTDTSAAAVSITSSGVFAARFGSSISNVKAPTQNGITVTNYQTAMHTAFFKGVAGQTGDQLHIEDSTGALLSRVDKAGYFMTRKSAAPILGDMANNEAAWHVVGTAGAEKIVFTIRNSAGALVTKELV